jgi:vacuolar-type H+-ATPase catalytic subunit A/Vma1
MTFPEAVALELKTARRAHAPLNSAHEAYALILEELDEFWEEVRRKQPERSSQRMASELIQIAAMAQRAAEDLTLIDATP